MHPPASCAHEMHADHFPRALTLVRVVIRLDDDGVAGSDTSTGESAILLSRLASILPDGVLQL